MAKELKLMGSRVGVSVASTSQPGGLPAEDIAEPNTEFTVGSVVLVGQTPKEDKFNAEERAIMTKLKKGTAVLFRGAEHSPRAKVGQQEVIIVSAHNIIGIME